MGMELSRSQIKNKKLLIYKILMDLDLDNVLEVDEIRKLISHKKNLLEFFNELIKVKNIMLTDEIDDTTTDDDYSTEED